MTESTQLDVVHILFFWMRARCNPSRKYRRGKTTKKGRHEKETSFHFDVPRASRDLTRELNVNTDTAAAVSGPPVSKDPF